MDTNSCVHHMLDKAGLSPNAACQSMGRANGYVDQSLKRKGGIGAPALAEIAQACGYKLQLAGRGETLNIDPANKSEAENTQKTPRKGRMSLFGNGSVTWDVFADDSELFAVTDPYEFPAFYHIGQREDGSWHVLSVEEHDYAKEGEGELERQLARVRGMRRLDVGDKGVSEAIRAMDLYVSCESPEARAKAEKRWQEVQEERRPRAGRGQGREVQEAREAARRAQAQQEGPQVLHGTLHHVRWRQVTLARIAPRSSRQNGPRRTGAAGRNIVVRRQTWN